MNPQTQTDPAQPGCRRSGPGQQGLVRRNGFEAGRQERRRSAPHGRRRQGRRSGRAVVRQAIPDHQQPGAPGHLGSRVAVELFQSKQAPAPPERAEGDGRFAGGRCASTSRPARIWTRIARCRSSVLNELGEAGYWGLLVDKQYGGAGSPFAAFASFLTKMAMVDPTVAGLASVHGCIGAVDPVRTFGNAEQKATLPARAGQRQAAVGFRADRTGRRFGPDGAARPTRC